MLIENITYHLDFILFCSLLFFPHVFSLILPNHFLCLLLLLSHCLLLADL